MLPLTTRLERDRRRPPPIPAPTGPLGPDHAATLAARRDAHRALAALRGDEDMKARDPGYAGWER